MAKSPSPPKNVTSVPRKKRRTPVTTVSAIVGAVLLSVVGVVSEALFRPIVNYIIFPYGLDLFGEQWTGIEVEPDPPLAAKNIVNGCNVEGRSDSKRVMAKLSTDNWRVITAGDNFLASLRDEEYQKDRKLYKVTGNRTPDWIIADITRPGEISHDILYLKQGTAEYYQGFEIAYDCHSKAKSALLCPYILVRSTDPDRIREMKSIMSEKPLECQPIIPEDGLPPKLVTSDTKVR